MVKTCTRCGVKKNVEEFYRSKTKGNIYISRCKKCIILLVKKYAEKNVEKINNIKRKYVERNKDKVKQSKLKWFDKNPNYKKEWSENKSKTDILYKLIKTIRGRFRIFLKAKNITKNDKTFDIVGCSPDFLKEHLEKQFKEGMSWENYGLYGWHIDHIIPLSSAKTEEEIYKLAHYTNLQPLWAKDNLAKGKKIIT